jgi:hypothetical protein
MRLLRIFTWHVHGSYLYYLAQGHQEFYLPTKPGRPEGYGGRTRTYSWPENVHEVPAAEVPNLDVDCILLQSRQHYLEDQHELFRGRSANCPASFWSMIHRASILPTRVILWTTRTCCWSTSRASTT